MEPNPIPPHPRPNPNPPALTGVVACTPDGVIGRDGDLPWRLSSDLRRFKQLTMGGTLVMGRKTWDSIGRPLPGRETVVMSRTDGLTIDGATVVGDRDALRRCVGELDRPAFVVGGAAIYRELADVIDRWVLTVVLADVEGDTRIEVPGSGFRTECLARYPAGPKDDYPTEVRTLVRAPS